MLDKIDNNSIRTVISLKDKYKQSLKEYPEVLNRFNGINHFINNIKDGSSLSESYLRASLSELISVDDILNKIYKIPFQIYKTKHPLLILLKIIRNLNIHIEPNKISSKDIDVTLYKKDITIDIIYISDLTIEMLNKIRTVNKDYKNIKNYNDLKDTLHWFNNLCREIGIREILFKAVDIYIELLNEYCLNKLKNTYHSK
jgi:hypothetical protein